MNENEAVYCLKADSESHSEVCEECDLYGVVGCDHCHEDAMELAIKALKDVQQYRAIGTPEECRKSVDICKAMAERRISLENMENYMKFEDECVKRGFTFNSMLEAREKQTAKRALHQGCYDKNGEWNEWNGINGKPYELCPSCRVNLCCEMPLDIKPKYCKNCGQKLDWRNEE